MTAHSGKETYSKKKSAGTSRSLNQADVTAALLNPSTSEPSAASDATEQTTNTSAPPAASSARGSSGKAPGSNFLRIKAELHKQVNVYLSSLRGNASNLARLVADSDKYYGFTRVQLATGGSAVKSAGNSVRSSSNTSLTTWKYNPNAPSLDIVFEYRNPYEATIPWLYDLTHLLGDETIPQFTKLRLVSRFLTEFDIDEAKKVGHVFRTFSRQVLVAISSPKYLTALLHTLRNGVDRLEEHAQRELPADATISAKYHASTITPLHASLMKLASTLSHHVIAAPYLPRGGKYDNPDSGVNYNQYLRPDSELGTNYATLFIYYYHASILLFEQENYVQALEHATTALVSCPWMQSEPVFVHHALALLAASNEKNISGEVKRDGAGTGSNPNAIELQSAHIAFEQHANALTTYQNSHPYTQLYGETAKPSAAILSQWSRIKKVVGSEVAPEFHSPAVPFLWEVSNRLSTLDKFELVEEVRAIVNKHRELYFLNLPEHYMSVGSSTVTDTDASREYLAHVYDPPVKVTKQQKQQQPLQHQSFQSNFQAGPSGASHGSGLPGTATPSATVHDLNTTGHSFLESPTARLSHGTTIFAGTATPTEAAFNHFSGADVSEIYKAKQERLQQQQEGGGAAGPSSSGSAGKEKEVQTETRLAKSKLPSSSREELTREFVYGLVMSRALNATIDEEPVSGDGDVVIGDASLSQQQSRENYWLTFHPGRFVERHTGREVNVSEQLARLREKLDTVGAVSRLTSECAADGMPRREDTVMGAVGAAHITKSLITSLGPGSGPITGGLEGEVGGGRGAAMHGRGGGGGGGGGAMRISRGPGPMASLGGEGGSDRSSNAQTVVALAAQQYADLVFMELEEYYPPGYVHDEQAGEAPTSSGSGGSTQRRQGRVLQSGRGYEQRYSASQHRNYKRGDGEESQGGYKAETEDDEEEEDMDGDVSLSDYVDHEAEGSPSDEDYEAYRGAKTARKRRGGPGTTTAAAAAGSAAVRRSTRLRASTSRPRDHDENMGARSEEDEDVMDISDEEDSLMG